MKVEQTECSETSAYKIQTPWNYPEENIQHTEHGGSLKSKTIYLLCVKSYKIKDLKNCTNFEVPTKQNNNYYPILNRAACKTEVYVATDTLLAFDMFEVSKLIS